VHLSGVGTVTMPGSHELRGVLGVSDPDAPAPAPGVDLGELFSHFRFGPPKSDTKAVETAALERDVLPVLEELRPTWYESPGECQIVEYSRGTFSDDGVCGGRPGERPFDETARADFDRILDAVERSGVPTHELREAMYDSDGNLVTCAFWRDEAGWEWNYAYVYSPDVRPPEPQTPLGPVVVSPIGRTGWWFEKSPDD
jgi:hypothetical protein